MTEIPSWLLDGSVVVYAVASMLSVGFGHTVGEVLGPLRSARAVLRALLANFVLVPILALLVMWLLPLDEPHAIGIFLIAAAAGAAFLIKLTEAAGSAMALSAALLVLLLPLTIIYMPLVVPLAVPEAEMSAFAIAMPLVLTMLVPLGLGLLARNRWAGWPVRLQPSMSAISTLALVVLILATILASLEGISDVLLSTAIFAPILVIGGAFVIGYLLGPDRARSEVLALGTAQRNIAAAMVVATQAVDDPDTAVMVIVAALVGFAILFPLAAWLRKRSPNER